MSKRMVPIAIGVLLLLLPSAVSAQWGADSLQNLQICDLTGEQCTPKMAATSDGGCFISWFDSRSGSYCLYLQRLDAQGNKMFAVDGLLVSSHPQESWLVDYDMAVDASDNAVIAFADSRHTAGEFDISAYKIGSDGTFLWGPDGVSLSDTSEPSLEAAPSVAVTESGNAVIAWGKSGTDYTIVLQKLSPDGDKLWGEDGIILDDPVRNLTLPRLAPASGDNAILLWKSSTGNFPYPVTHLYTGMLDPSGSWAWGGSPVLIYDSGHISAWTNPEVLSDGEGGAVCSWYDAVDLSTFEVWVQHMDASGDMLFPMNGAQASTNTSNRLHMYPSAAYFPDQDQTVVFWVEENDNQDQYGVYGQSFSASGARQWTDAGLQLVPLGSQQISFVRALADAEGVYVGFFRGASGTSVRSMRLGSDGVLDWGPVTLSAASLGGKDDLVLCEGTGQSALYAWCDYRNDYGIYAQGVSLNGWLGPTTGTGAEGEAACRLSVCPNPSAGSVSLDFATDSAGRATLEIYDLSGRLVDIVFSGTLEPGPHSFGWAGDGRGRPAAGVYLVRLNTAAGMFSARLVVI